MGLQLRIEISARISVNFQFQARPQCSSPLIRYVGANRFEFSDRGCSTLGFGLASLPGGHHGYTPPWLKTKQTLINTFV